MRFNVIKRLFFTNLAYANPTLTNKYRNKYNGTKDIRKKIFNYFLLADIANIIFFTAIFSSIVSTPNFSNSYTNFLLLLSALIALNLSTLFLNMFYESTDTSAILPLPISAKELFFGKLFTLIFQISGAFIPIIAISVMISLRTAFTLTSLSISIIYSLALVIIIVGTLMLLLSRITYIPNFAKKKNTINGILIIIGMLVFGGYIVLSNQTYSDSVNFSNNQKGNFLVDILTKPIDEMYINLSILILIALFIAFLVNKVIAANYLSDIKRIENIDFNKSSSQRESNLKNTKRTSLRQKLIKRNLKLFAHGTLLANIFSGMFFSIIILINIIIQVRNSGGIYLGGEYFPLAMCFGFSMAVIMVANPISFPATAISLERGDYYQLLTLPIDFKGYLKLKLIISIILELSTGLIIFIASLSFSKINFSFIAISAISFILTGIFISFLYFAKDFNNLNLTWNNIMELSRRGKSQVFLTFIAFIILGLLITTNIATYFLISNYGSFISILLGSIYIVILISCLIFASLRIKKTVFNKIL